MGYNTVALDHTIKGKVPATITNQIPLPLTLAVPPSLRILRRCTLQLSDPGQNHRLSSLASNYDLFAIRPTTEKALQQACQSLECDIISLDLSTRFSFYFKIKTLQSALMRGIKIEICYAPGIINSDGGASRRNLISNAAQLIRATRGRGVVISSEAKRALACRGPADVINLAVMWGLGNERGTEAIGREARSVVLQAEMKRRSYQGVVDVIYGGDRPSKPVDAESKKSERQEKGKRKVEVLEAGDPEIVTPKPPSKREQKRQAKKARLEAAKAVEGKDADAEIATDARENTLLPVQSSQNAKTRSY